MSDERIQELETSLYLKISERDTAINRAIDLETTMNTLQEALNDAAHALGRDRGRRNETIAQRIAAIRQQRDDWRRISAEQQADYGELQERLRDVDLLAEMWLRSSDPHVRLLGADLKQIVQKS